MRLCPIWLILLLSDIGEVVPFSVMPALQQRRLPRSRHCRSQRLPCNLSESLTSPDTPLIGLLFPPLPSSPSAGLPVAPPHGRPASPWNPTVHRGGLVALPWVRSAGSPAQPTLLPRRLPRPGVPSGLACRYGLPSRRWPG